jgi:hypothetical protein
MVTNTVLELCTSISGSRIRNVDKSLEPDSQT